MLIARIVLALTAFGLLAASPVSAQAAHLHRHHGSSHVRLIDPGAQPLPSPTSGTITPVPGGWPR